MRLSRSILLGAAVAGTLVLGRPPEASAQGFILDAYAGVAFPTSNISGLVKPGFSGGFGFGYLANNRVGLRGDLAGEWLSADDNPVTIPLGIEGADIRLYHYDASVMFNFTDPRDTPYLFALDIGAGATTIDFSGDNVTADNRTRFTIPFGIALGYRVGSNVALFVRGRWYLIFTSESVVGNSTWSTFPLWGGIAIRPGG